MIKRFTKEQRIKFIMHYGLPFLIGLMLGIAGFQLTKIITCNTYIIGNSMNPTLYEGDCVIGLKFGLIHPDLERGDVINFIPPIEDEKDLFTKRIIGLPGDKVVIEGGKIYLNGSQDPLDEPYLTEDWIVDAGPYVFEVPEGYYLVLGDNRNNSYDSRDWDNPYVAYDAVQSKTCFIYKPHFIILH